MKYCFSSIYIAVLLQHTLSMEHVIQQSNVKTLKHINNQTIDWAIGSVVWEVMQGNTCNTYHICRHAARCVDYIVRGVDGVMMTERKMTESTKKLRSSQRAASRYTLWSIEFILEEHESMIAVALVTSLVVVITFMKLFLRQDVAARRVVHTVNE